MWECEWLSGRNSPPRQSRVRGTIWNDIKGSPARGGRAETRDVTHSITSKGPACLFYKMGGIRCNFQFCLLSLHKTNPVERAGSWNCLINKTLGCWFGFSLPVEAPHVLKDFIPPLKPSSLFSQFCDAAGYELQISDTKCKARSDVPR